MAEVSYALFSWNLNIYKSVSSSRTQRHLVFWISSDVSEEYIAFIFMTEELAKQGILWRWKRHAPPKRLLTFNKLEVLYAYTRTRISLSVQTEQLSGSKHVKCLFNLMVMTASW
jgi:hypothetical protein